MVALARLVGVVVLCVAVDRIVDRNQLDQKVADGARWIYGKARGVFGRKRKK